MKKLEKLGSKLFDAFRGDEVSELASVVGGATKQTVRNGGECDIYNPGSSVTTDAWTGEKKDVKDCPPSLSSSISGEDAPTDFFESSNFFSSAVQNNAMVSN